MVLSEIGKLAHKFWQEIPVHFQFIQLDAFVIMPNHVHGILIIDKPGANNQRHHSVETPNLGVSTISDSIPAFLNADKKLGGKNEKWKPETIGVIINQYKRVVTINARKTNPDFAWQSRFYDHIIRNESAFDRIADYIRQNPSNWTDDKFYS